VHQWLRAQTKTFFYGIKKLVGRWEKCIAKQGDCIEKWCNLLLKFLINRVTRKKCGNFLKHPRIRIQAAHNLRRLYKQQSKGTQYNSIQAIKEHRTLNQIKEKLRSNEAVISKSDKGNSTVILYRKAYHNKVQDFINSNNFIILSKDSTKLFQSRVKATIKGCQLILPKASKIKLTNMNPVAPSIWGLPKVHKVECPIRPVVNWQGAPA
jgi:hypothetical protein